MSPSEIELVGDVGKLKGQVEALTSIAGKLDIIIDKLVDQHDRHIAKVYTDMDKRRLETESDVREIHERIDTVLDKMQSMDKCLSEKIDSLRDAVNTHNKEERKQFILRFGQEGFYRGQQARPDCLGISQSSGGFCRIDRWFSDLGTGSSTPHFPP